MSVFAELDAEIENGFSQFRQAMNLDDTLWIRHAFYITSISFLHSDPLEDEFLQHLMMTRLEHHRTLMLAMIVYKMFFPKF